MGSLFKTLIAQDNIKKVLKHPRFWLGIGFSLGGVTMSASCINAPGTQPFTSIVTPLAPELTRSFANEIPTGESSLAPEAVSAVPTSTIPPTESPAPKIVGVQESTDSESPLNWRAPSTEDTFVRNVYGAESLTPELQNLIQRAQETVAATGFGGASVEFISNGLPGDDFRGAVVVKSPGGDYIVPPKSAYPSQLNVDGRFIEGNRYTVVADSVGAEFVWTPGLDNGGPTEPTLVMHQAILDNGTQVPLLYRNPFAEQYAPLIGFPTAENFVAVGNRVFQYSPEDGSATEIGSIKGLSSIAINNGRIEFFDQNGTVSWWNAETGRIENDQMLQAERVGIPNPAEYSLGQLGVEQLVAYKEVTYLDGSTYELFGDAKEPGIVYLARNKETGEVSHALYIEARAEGGVPVLLLTSPEVAQEQGYFVSFNPDAIDVTTVNANGEGGTPVSRAKAYALLQEAYEQMFAINYAYENLDEYQYLRNDGQKGYYPIGDLSMDQRRNLVNDMVQKWRNHVAGMNYPASTELFNNRPLTFSDSGIVIRINASNNVYSNIFNLSNTMVDPARVFPKS